MVIDLAAIEALSKLEKAATSVRDWKCIVNELLDHEDDEFPRWVLPMGPRQRLDDYGDGDKERYDQATADVVLINALRNAAPELMDLAAEALAAREMLTALAVADHASCIAAERAWRALVSAHDEQREGEK